MAQTFTAHLSHPMTGLAGLATFNWFMAHLCRRTMALGGLVTSSWPMAHLCRQTMATGPGTSTPSWFGFVGEHLNPEIRVGVHP
jgi:hypothetical protein